MWLTVYWHETRGSAREAVDELVSFMSQMYPISNNRRSVKKGKHWREHAIERQKRLESRARKEILKASFGDEVSRFNTCTIWIRVPVWADLSGSRAINSPWVEYMA